MKAFTAVAALILSLVGSMGTASAQYYGGPYGGPSYQYRERDYGYPSRRYENVEPRPRYRSRQYVFNERRYLGCNADVRRAVNRGETSAWEHYQQFGRYENRQLDC